MSADHRARSSTRSPALPRARRTAPPAAGIAACALLVGALLAGCGAQAPQDAPPAAESGESTGRSSSSSQAQPTTTTSRPPIRSTEQLPGQSSPGAPTTGRTTPRYTPPASLPAPYIAQTWWEDSPYGPTLKIAPTPNGRQTPGYDDGMAAWAEVLRHDPGADTPGMREQFICHWDFARLVEPDKESWNIEPWRPVVDAGEMILTQCNPGGPEV